MTGHLILVPTPLGNLGDLTRRAEEVLAAADLVALGLAMESLYQRQLVYPQPASNPTADTAATQAYLASGGVSSPWSPARGDRFAYTVQAASGSYTLTATGLPGGSNAGCQLTLSSNNVRAVSGGSACGGVSVW